MTKEGKHQFRTVMKNTCEHITLVFTVYMKAEDWDNIEFFYRRYDEQDQSMIKNDSNKTKCAESKNNPGNVGCTFELGFVDDFEERGMTHGRQTLAGWVNAPGARGIIQTTRRW